jgi:polysaccharide export outer membrane protein
VFKFKEGMNVAKAITQAGGLTDQADSQDIKLLRASKELPQTNMETAVLPGDVLVVGGGNEPGLFFYVYGAVARPGSFPYRDDLSVEKAVILAGGFSARASRRKVKIKHEDGVELDRVALETPVRPGDIITVGESLF